MAVITDATEAWATGVTLAADEFWQVTEGGPARFTHESTPAVNDGAYVPLHHGLIFASGTTVKYRKATAAATVITRTQVR